MTVSQSPRDWLLFAWAANEVRGATTLAQHFTALTRAYAGGWGDLTYIAHNAAWALAHLPAVMAQLH